MIKFNLKNNIKYTIILIFILIAIYGVSFFIKSNSKDNNVEEIQKRIDSQQAIIDELQVFKNERLKLEQEEVKLVEEENILTEKQVAKNSVVGECNQKNELCQSKIYDIKKVSYKGNYSSFLNIDDADKHIKSLEKLIDQWKDDKKDCNSGSEQQIKECKSIVDKRIEKAENDVEEIKKLIKKTKDKLEAITNGEECKNYEKPCG